MKYEKEKEFIKEMQGGVLLNDYTLNDMLWLMRRYAEKVANENIANEPMLKTGRKCIHAICSKDDCPFVMNDEIECPLP